MPLPARTAARDARASEKYTRLALTGASRFHWPALDLPRPSVSALHGALNEPVPLTARRHVVCIMLGANGRPLLEHEVHMSVIQPAPRRKQTRKTRRASGRRVRELLLELAYQLHASHVIARPVVTKGR